MNPMIYRRALPTMAVAAALVLGGTLFAVAAGDSTTRPQPTRQHPISAPDNSIIRRRRGRSHRQRRWRSNSGWSSRRSRPSRPLPFPRRDRHPAVRAQDCWLLIPIATRALQTAKANRARTALGARDVLARCSRWPRALASGILIPRFSRCARGGRSIGAPRGSRVAALTAEVPKWMQTLKECPEPTSSWK
jgi:hypothetical protein